MDYYKAHFTLFDKSTPFLRDIKSPNIFHQLILPHQRTVISDSFDKKMASISKDSSILIYPLLHYSLQGHQVQDKADILSINSMVFENQLFSSDFFSEINAILKRTDVSMLLLDQETTAAIQPVYSKLTNDFKLEYMMAIFDILHIIAHSKNLIIVCDTADNEKQRLFFNQVNEYIEVNIANNVEIKEIAAYFYLSESLFSHRFRKIFDAPFHHYLIGKKIEKSCELLRNSEHSIQEIAYTLGFNSTSHFISKFKQLKNTTPGRYRSLL